MCDSTILIHFLMNLFHLSAALLYMWVGVVLVYATPASYFVVYCNQHQVMARRSERLRSRDPEIVEMEFECFVFVSWKVLRVKRTFYA